MSKVVAGFVVSFVEDIRSFSARNNAFLEARETAKNLRAYVMNKCAANGVLIDEIAEVWLLQIPVYLELTRNRVTHDKQNPSDTSLVPSSDEKKTRIRENLIAAYESQLGLMSIATIWVDLPGLWHDEFHDIGNMNYDMYWATNPLVALAIPKYFPGGQVRDVLFNVIAGLIRHTLTIIAANAMKRGVSPNFHRELTRWLSSSNSSIESSMRW
jgi:hypothetical protein